MKKAMLIILDGFGYSPKKEYNAIANAKKPFFDSLIKDYPNTLIQASGEAVGLPAGQMGNSEVGHLNLGAGRIVYQDFTRINKAIEDGTFFENEVLKDAFLTAKERNSKVHLMGLVSDGGVHSHIKHLFALLDMAKKIGVEKTFVHAITDGRDTSPVSGKGYIKQLLDYMKNIGWGKLATVIGRYWAMDRDKRWDRIKKAYDAFVNLVGEETNEVLDTIQKRYDNNETDEFLNPIIVDKAGKIENNDVVIFFNFRADRARQITIAFTDKNFSEFEKNPNILIDKWICMTEYDKNFPLPVAYPPIKLKNVLAEYLSNLGLKQFHTAETEKYAHVTFFFNGGREEPFSGEDRLLVPSPKVATYDLKPEMSAYEVADNAVEKINSGKYDFIVLNFANPDMVGHTGVYEAAVKAIEAVDENLAKVVKAAKNNGYEVIVTADHGNAEQMIDYETGQPFTEHTTNPVYFVVVSEKYKNAKLREDGKLCDVAPTILQLMELEIPAEFEGKSIII